VAAEKETVAEALGTEMQVYGGITAEIAGQWAAAMKDLADLQCLLEQLQAEHNVWASQTVEAKRGSHIEDTTQHYERRSQTGNLRQR
jgi:hypothetical protein